MIAIPITMAGYANRIVHVLKDPHDHRIAGRFQRIQLCVPVAAFAVRLIPDVRPENGIHGSAWTLRPDQPMDPLEELVVDLNIRHHHSSGRVR
jgi:hypothetical protein